MRTPRIARKAGPPRLNSCKAACSPRPPFIRRSTCSDAIEILPTTLNPDHIYYTTNGNAPSPADLLMGTQEYTIGSLIDWPAGSNMQVKAIAVTGDYDSTVPVADVTFGDKTGSGNDIV